MYIHFLFIFHSIFFKFFSFFIFWFIISFSLYYYMAEDRMYIYQASYFVNSFNVCSKPITVNFFFYCFSYKARSHVCGQVAGCNHFFLWLVCWSFGLYGDDVLFGYKSEDCRRFFPDLFKYLEVDGVCVVKKS